MQVAVNHLMCDHKICFQECDHYQLLWRPWWRTASSTNYHYGIQYFHSQHFAMWNFELSAFIITKHFENRFTELRERWIWNLQFNYLNFFQFFQILKILWNDPFINYIRTLSQKFQYNVTFLLLDRFLEFWMFWKADGELYRFNLAVFRVGKIDFWCWTA